MTKSTIAALLDRFLNAPSASAPSYAADGRLYFLNDAAGSAQVWELPPDGGPATARTAHRDAVGFVAGSPADGGAVFGRDGAGDERNQFYVLPPGGAAKALTADPATMFGWGAFAPDGARIACTSNSRSAADADPCVIALGTGEIRRIRAVEGPHEVVAWHPDGRSIMLASSPSAFKSDLMRVDVETGETTDVATTANTWRHTNPRWRRDGSAFWLLSDRERSFLGVAVCTPPAAPRFIFAPEADVERFEVSPDHTMLAVTVNEGGYSRLRLLDANTGAERPAPAHPRGVITKLSWRPDGGAIAFDLSRPTAPITLWLAEIGAAEARELFAASPQIEGARDYETVAFTTFDGLSVPAYFATPEGAMPEGGWPVLIWVHGGPEAQALPRWQPDLQTMLALGIAVLIPNVRGSTGYGRAYAALDDRELRPNAVRDLAAAHAWLSARADVDASRIAVSGQSYGGWMVLSAVTTFPELWKCAIDFYGIARWKTFFEQTGPWRVGHRAAEYGDPVKDAALLESLSPLHRADRIVCPMLVAQGLTDPSVPPRESEQIVAALRSRNIPVEYLTFPDEGHGFLKRDNRRTVYTAVARFLARHLLDIDVETND
jgi:dipeptidyl aminopeptidase/acylaminoacyl peptidase